MRFATFFLLAGIVSMTAEASAQSGVSTPREAAEVFIAATAAGDAGRIAALYATDALMLAPGAAPIAGRDAIKAVFQRNFSLGRNAIAFSTIRMDTGSDRAAVYWGWVSEIAATSGAVRRMNGRSFVYFRKEGDVWVISADMMHVAPAQ